MTNDVLINHYRVNPKNSLGETLSVMRSLNIMAKTNPDFQAWVKKKFNEKCSPCLIKKIWEYVRQFEYKPDTYDEVIIAPYVLPVIKKGDCDDFSLFIKTVLDILQIESKYILFGRESGVYTHIAVFCLGTLLDGTNKNFNSYPVGYKYRTFLK